MKEWTQEEKDRAAAQIGFVEHDDGEAFFSRHPKMGFACAVNLQCEVNAAVDIIHNFVSSAEQKDPWVAVWLDRNIPSNH